MLLCAANLYPDPKIYLGFAMCLIKDYQDIPQRGHFEDCALEHAIDFEKLSDCASQDDGAFGVDMLRTSVRRSAEVGLSEHPDSRHFSLNYLPRLALPSVARCDSTRRSTVFGTGESGQTVRMELESMTWFLRLRSCTARLERLEDVRPQLASLSERITQRYRIHTHFLIVAHALEMLNNTLQSDRLPRRLRRTRFQSHVDDVDVKMIVRGLVVDIELQLVALNIVIYLCRGLDELGLHVLEPGDVLDFEIAQAPDVAALHEAQQVESFDGLLVPIQIRCEKETLVTSLTKRGSVDHVLDFFSALDDIEHPVQPALVALRLHVRSDVVAIDLGRLGHEAHALLAVFLDVLLCARVDEVDLQVGELVLILGVFDGTAAGHVPVVNVVGAQILECPQTAGYGAKVVVGAGEGRALEDEQRGLLVNGAAQRRPAPCLVLGSVSARKQPSLEEQEGGGCTLIEQTLELEAGHEVFWLGHLDGFYVVGW